MFKFKNVAESYQNIIIDILGKPDYVTSPRNQKIYEKINYTFSIENVLENLVINEVRNTPFKYLANELILYFSGEHRLKKYSNASKFWTTLYPENYEGPVNSAYGNLIFNGMEELEWSTQWDWAVKSLLKDKDSRQAIIHFNNPNHQHVPYNDFVCTLTGQFLIRDNKINLIINMRSQDLYFGYIFDVVFFTMLMQCMRFELLDKYPELELGTYYHNVGSIHIYERNKEIFEKMLSAGIFKSASLPILTKSIIKCPEIMYLNNETIFSTDDAFFNWLICNK